MSATLLPAPAARTVRRQRIITGTSSFTAPEGVTSALVLLVSGGGAGFYIAGTASVGTGGGGGGVAVRTVATTPGTTYPILVGSGGAAAASNTYGSSGGTTSAFGVALAGGRRAAPIATEIANPGTFGSGFGNAAPGVDTPWGRFGNGGDKGGVIEGGNGYSQPGDTGASVANGRPPAPGDNSGHGGNTTNNTTHTATSGASGIVIIEWEEAA